MKLELRRFENGKTYTEGSLSTGGVRLCNIIEPADRGLTSDMELAEIRKRKVAGRTAIPTGTYKIVLSMSPTFKRVLPLLCGTKGFAGVRIHRGNTSKDSRACLLPGDHYKTNFVTNSTVWERRLITMLQEAEQRGEENTITITRDYVCKG